MITALLITALLGSTLCPSCRRSDAAVVVLPDPADDDRPAGSAPELPRLSVEMPPVSHGAPTRVLGTGDDLQEAINSAKPGDVIALRPRSVFTGNFTLPAKTGDGWITIRSMAPEMAFPPGTRVTPAHMSQMPVIEAEENFALATTEGAHHYRFIGVEIRPRAGTFISTLVMLGGDHTSFEALPHHFVFERCYIHGDPNVGGRRGVALNARHVAVIDSYLADFKERGYDSQAIAGWNGTGPFAILNNYIEASGENVMFGGADPDVKNLVPSDIDIRGNHFRKPLEWRGSWTVKNLFELKNARRVLIDKNVFENNWVDAQNGFAILFTVRNQDGGSPWAMVRDVTFTRNIVRHTASGVNILGTDDLHPSYQTKRITIRDNVFDNVDGPKWGGAGRLFQILDGPADVVIDHNTAVHTGDVMIGEYSPSERFVFTNNLMPHNQYGIGGSNTFGNPPSALATYFPGISFVKNVLIGGYAPHYPVDNFFPAAVADVGFADFAAGNYRLTSKSPYKNAGTDGKDIGANLDAIDPPPGRRRSVSTN